MKTGLTLGAAATLGLVLLTQAPARVRAAAPDVPDTVTYTKDIAPILQRSCENCHRADGVAPMSLMHLRGSAPLGPRDQAAYRYRPQGGCHASLVHREEHRHPALQERPVAERDRGCDYREMGRQGAARGNPADMPPARTWDDAERWTIGTPDLIVKLPEIVVKGNAADWWGEMAPAPTGLDEDRYVAALEIKEVNDVPSSNGSGRATVGGRYVFHHMIWAHRQGRRRRRERAVAGARGRP